MDKCSIESLAMQEALVPRGKPRWVNRVSSGASQAHRANPAKEVRISKYTQKAEAIQNQTCFPWSIISSGQSPLCQSKAEWGYANHKLSTVNKLRTSKRDTRVSHVWRLTLTTSTAWEELVCNRQEPSNFE